MAHAAELLWATLFMLAWSRALDGGLANHATRRWAAVAGLALGALFLTRQFTALTIGLSFGVSLGAMYILKCVAPSARPAPPGQAVSYTHLDVYKRQVPSQGYCQR